MTDGLTAYPGESALTVAEDLGYLHRFAFDRRSPGLDDERVRRFVERLGDEARQPGFLAVTARIEGRLCGFGTALRTPDPLPDDVAHHQVAEELGPDRAADWLAGAIRVRDLVVAPQARGLGLGRRMLDRLTAAAPARRAWAATASEDEGGLRFLRSTGWRQTVFPAGGETSAAVVFLAPGHPALAPARVLP
jgi:GNAT superfamily N-acetyltransferase